MKEACRKREQTHVVSVSAAERCYQNSRDFIWASSSLIVTHVVSHQGEHGGKVVSKIYKLQCD